MFSTRERSDPLGPSGVRIERQRFPVGVSATVHLKFPLPSPRNPPFESGYSVIQRTGSGPDIPVPTRLVRESICSIVYRTARPVASSPSLCHASVDARERSRVCAPKRRGNCRPSAGWLLRYHWLSSSDTWIPPSPSNDSRYACPATFGSGRLAANSPETLIRDGAVVAPYGKCETRLVSGDASKLNSAVTPATSDPAGSNPSGGRLNVVVWV